MLSRDVLLADVHDRLFGGGRSEAQPTLGLEIEFIPQNQSDHRATPLFGAGGTLEIVRRVAERQGWTEHWTRERVPWFSAPAGGSVTFEPGGQIEYSTPAHQAATPLLRDARQVAAALMQEAERAGVELVTTGIDPYNDIADTPLQLRTTRYESMASHFARLGPAGGRMMRQTTAVQVNLGLGPDALGRWRLLNALAPVLTALFANSRRYAGRDTGYASYRAQIWAETDPSRTGRFAGQQASADYLNFALRAAAFLPPFERAEIKPFCAWLSSATLDDWRAHLTTLFPDVRPKGYFEVRCIDGQAPEMYAAVLATVLGVTCDPASVAAAEGLLPRPTADLGERAVKEGLADPELRTAAAGLVELALAGCRRLSSDMLAEDDLDSATQHLTQILTEQGPSYAGAASGVRTRLLR